MTERSVLWVLAVLIAIAGLALALLLPDIDWADRLRFGAIGIVAFCALLLLAYTLRERLSSWAPALLNSRGERYFPALWVIFPLVPTAAMAITAIAFLAWKDDYVLLIGPGVATAGLFALGIIGIRYVEFENANLTTYGDFLSRVHLLELRRDLLTNSDADKDMIKEAAAEATRQLDVVTFLMNKKGFLWVRGHGYNSLWVAVHSAEAAVLKALTTEAVVREGLYDESRLHDSEIDHREELLARLRNAISALDPSAVKSFYATFNPPTGSDSPEPAAARETISEVRTELNSFNDSNYEGIVRVRNTTLNIVPFAGLMGLIAVAMAILSGADQKHIVAFLGFFVAGSFAGLASWVFVDLKATSSIQDFGLATARLFRTIAFSGLIAAAGVFLFAALLGAAGLNPAIAKVSTDPTPAPSQTASPDAGDSEPGDSPGGDQQGPSGKRGDSPEIDGQPASDTHGDALAAADPESSPFGATESGAPSAIVTINLFQEGVSPGQQPATPTPTPFGDLEGTPEADEDEVTPTPSLGAEDDEGTAAATNDPDTTCDDDKVWPLRCVYDLEENPFGLIVAMILGVTPELLVSMLKLQGDRYLQHLKSTKPADSG